MLAKGLQIIEELFPGIRKELVDAGAEELDPGLDIVWLTPAGWGKPCEGPHFLSCSRPFLDRHIRRRMADLKNVKIISGADATRLLHDPIRKEITGVSIKFDEEPTEREVAVNADLIVDASGRHSRAPQWLTALGYETPRETIVNALSRLCSGSRTFRLPTGWVQGNPDTVRTTEQVVAEYFSDRGRRLILTLSGGGGDYPSSDEDRFLEFAQSLRACKSLNGFNTSNQFLRFVRFETRKTAYVTTKKCQLPGRFV